MTERTGRVTCDLSISVDGYSAGLNQTEQRPFGDDGGDGWGNRLHAWMFKTPEENRAEVDQLTAALACCPDPEAGGDPVTTSWDTAAASWFGPGADGPAGRGPPTLTFVAAGTMVNRMVKSQSQALDRTFSALADPTRRAILQRLGHGPATISELAEPFGLSLPGLMKHVRILEQAELVTTEKHGRTRQCWLGPEHLDDAARWIRTYQRRWEGRLDRLGSYLEKHKGGPR